MATITKMSSLKDLKCKIKGYSESDDYFIIDIEGTIKKMKPSILKFSDSEIEWLKEEGIYDLLVPFYRFNKEEKRFSKYRP